MLELCLCAYAWIYSRARVHTGHVMLYHLLCAAVEAELFAE